MSEPRKIRWNEFLMDANGEFSFKRLVPAICIILFVVYFFVNLFTGRVLDQHALDLIMWVTISCVAAQTIEPFSKFRKTTIVSKDATVIQEASPTADTEVSRAVEKIVSTSTPPPTIKQDEKVTKKDGQETMPEMLE